MSVVTRFFSLSVCCVIALSAMLAVSPLFAQPKDTKPKEKIPYIALGSPAKPKVTAQWNRYHDYAESTALLQELAKAHPERCRLESLGQSYGKREMWLLTITNFAQGKPETKSAFWIDGGIHANEIQSVEVPLYTAWYLLEMYPQNEAIRRLVDERVFYIVPMMSPDSRDAHFYEPNTTHSPRTGQRPVDDDRDGLVDEDGPNDLDGDGNITQMRVKDPNGRWKKHPDFPELMVRAKEGEKGEYRLLGAEGIDNDGDGRVNEDGPGGYDPNRNWPWYWQPEYVQDGAHRYPLSLNEDRMVAEFMLAHPQIAGAQSYHNAGGMILRGPGAKSDSFEPSDLAIYDRIGKKGEEILPGYKYINVANDLYEVYGGEIDFMHQMCGAYIFTNELFTPFNYFGKDEHGWFASDETQRLFDKYVLLGEGVVPWHEVDHPTFGKIEVGGLKKTWTRQPPAFLLEEECHRNMAFTMFHAEQLPLVKIQNVEVKPVEGGLTQITAVLENQRFCPTHSAADVKRKLTPPDMAAISSTKEMKVLLAWSDESPFFENPREQPREPARIKVPNIAGNSVVYVRWLVQGAGPFQIDLTSIKGGVDTRAAP